MILLKINNKHMEIMVIMVRDSTIMDKLIEIIIIILIKIKINKIITIIIIIIIPHLIKVIISLLKCLKQWP
jgi:hypothetical protein